MQEDRAEGDVLLLHAVVEEEEDPLLRLEGGGMEERGVPEDLAGDRPRAVAEDIVFDGVQSVSPTT
eukprot:8528420-Alexandrium_andersonii.AAC.1